MLLLAKIVSGRRERKRVASGQTGSSAEAARCCCPPRLPQTVRPGNTDASIAPRGIPGRRTSRLAATRAASASLKRSKSRARLESAIAQHAVWGVDDAPERVGLIPLQCQPTKGASSKAQKTEVLSAFNFALQSLNFTNVTHKSKHFVEHHACRYWAIGLWASRGSMYIGLPKARIINRYIEMRHKACILYMFATIHACEGDSEMLLCLAQQRARSAAVACVQGCWVVGLAG